MSEQAKGERVFRSMREFCETFFPEWHAARECACYPKPERGVLVILPLPGVTPRFGGQR